LPFRKAIDNKRWNRYVVSKTLSFDSC